jgi:hypothetical protein
VEIQNKPLDMIKDNFGWNKPFAVHGDYSPDENLRLRGAYCAQAYRQFVKT